MRSPLTEMSYHKARELLTFGWSLNGEWLLLDHDETAMLWRVSCHNAAGYLWSTSCPYQSKAGSYETREFVLKAAAAWSLGHSGVAPKPGLVPPHRLVTARVRYMPTPLVSMTSCTARRIPQSVCIASAGGDKQADCRAWKVSA